MATINHNIDSSINEGQENDYQSINYQMNTFRYAKVSDF